jgi:hypothetical protein
VLRAAVTGFLLAAAVAAAFAGVRLERFGVRAFVLAGNHAAAGPLDVQLHRPPGPGYDGQFFYRLALDPVTSTRAEHGVRLDRPAYRQARIVYPTLAWMLSGGNDGVVPLALVGVNVAAFGAVGALSAALARHLNGSASTGLVLAAYPGFAVSIARDLSEVVAAALLLGAILSLRCRRTTPAVTLLTAAALTRETAVVFACVAAVVAVVEHRRLPPALPYAVPAVVLGCWQSFLTWRWGELPTPPLPAFDVPLFGLLNAGRWTVLDMAGAAVLGAVVLVAAWSLQAGAARVVRVPAWSLVPYVALLLSLGVAVWVEAHAFLRAATEVHLAAGVVALARPADGLAAVAVLNGLATLLFITAFVLVH